MARKPKAPKRKASKSNVWTVRETASCSNASPHPAHVWDEGRKHCPGEY